MFSKMQIKRKPRRNPSRDIKYLHQKLDSELTQYDAKLSKKQPNIYRLGHYLAAADKAFENLSNTSTDEDVIKSLNRCFSDLPPVNKFIKSLKK